MKNNNLIFLIKEELNSVIRLKVREWTNQNTTIKLKKIIKIPPIYGHSLNFVNFNFLKEIIKISFKLKRLLVRT